MALLRRTISDVKMQKLPIVEEKLIPEPTRHITGEQYKTQPWRQFEPAASLDEILKNAEQLRHRLVIKETGMRGDCLFTSFSTGLYLGTLQSLPQIFPVKILRQYVADHMLHRYNTEENYRDAMENTVRLYLNDLVTNVREKLNWPEQKDVDGRLQQVLSGEGTTEQFKRELNNALRIEPSNVYVQSAPLQHLVSLIFPYLTGRLDKAQIDERFLTTEQYRDYFRRAIAQYAFVANSQCSAFAERDMVLALSDLFKINVRVLARIATPDGHFQYFVDGSLNGEYHCFMYLYNQGNHFELLGCLNPTTRTVTVLFGQPLDLAFQRLVEYKEAPIGSAAAFGAGAAPAPAPAPTSAHPRAPRRAAPTRPQQQQQGAIRQVTPASALSSLFDGSFYRNHEQSSLL
jgi:hypothetical protein